MKTLKSKKPISKDAEIAFSVFLSGFSCFAQLYYFQPLLPDLAKHFHLSVAESSLAVSLATLGMALGLFSAMFFADRVSRKKFIAFSLFFSSILSVISSFSANFTMLIIINMMKGFLLSGSAAVSLTYIAEEVSLKNRTRITGSYVAGNGLGGMLGRVSAAWITGIFSWQTASEIIAGVCLIFSILFIFFAPESKNFKPRKESFLPLFKENVKLMVKPKLLKFYFTGFIILGCFVSLYNYLAFYLVKPPFNFPKEYMHYIYLMYIFGIFGSISTARISKFIPPYRLLKTVIIFGIFGISLLYISQLSAVIIGLGIFTFSFFVTHIVCTRLLGEVYPEKRSVIIAIYLLFYYSGSSSLGSLTGLTLQNFGYQYFLLSLVLLMSILLMIFWRKKDMKAV